LKPSPSAPQVRPKAAGYAPDDGAQRARRAAWLVLFGLLLPGSAQLIRGNRRLARLALVLWLAPLATVITLLIAWLEPRWLLNLAASPTALYLVAGFAVSWVLGYLFFALHTLGTAGLGAIKPKQRVLPVTATILAVALALTGGWQAVSISSAQASLLNQVFSATAVTEPVAGRYNILLLGADAGKNRLGLRPDSISVVSIDAETGSAVTIGIPRNLQKVRFAIGSPMNEVFPEGYSCGSECLINAVYTEVEENHADKYPLAAAMGSSPGIEATREAVEYVTGLEIQSFVLIDMAGFANLVQALGGVSVTVETAIPIGGKYNEVGELENPRDWIQPGTQRLSGEEALWFARSRYQSSDYERMLRQRELQRALLNQLDPLTVAANFSALAEAGASMVITDVPREMLTTYATLALSARERGVDQLELTPPLVDVVDPNFFAIRNMVAKATRRYLTE
jgi:polyisoprenyl-teichoic acid--peptidoglycan teichoic acid transferase